MKKIFLLLVLFTFGCTQPIWWVDPGYRAIYKGIPIIVTDQSTVAANCPGGYGALGCLTFETHPKVYSVNSAWVLSHECEHVDWLISAMKKVEVDPTYSFEVDYANQVSFDGLKFIFWAMVPPPAYAVFLAPVFQSGCGKGTTVEVKNGQMKIIDSNKYENFVWPTRGEMNRRRAKNGLEPYMFNEPEIDNTKGSFD